MSNKAAISAVKTGYRKKINNNNRDNKSTRNKLNTPFLIPFYYCDCLDVRHSYLQTYNIILYNLVG